MSVHYTDDAITLHHGDALDVLAGMPDRSVDCCVTSPPYFGLRDYGTAVWVDADPDCEHQMGDKIAYVCVLCGGVKKDAQYGLEASPAEYVERMRQVFAQVRRVLADDGTCWLNLGDSYATTIKGSGGTAKVTLAGPATGSYFEPRRVYPDVPAKNLLGMPWRVAFALQADGWTLRNAIVWAKPNAMPESVTDRLSTRYELVFLLTKSRRYWFDLDAIREPATTADRNGERASYYPPQAGNDPQWTRATSGNRSAGLPLNELGRNPGDVWTVPTAPFAAAHFAVMPLALAERCIQAGCPPQRCTECGHAPTRTTGERTLDMSRPQARRAHDLAAKHGLTDEHIAAIRAVGANDAGKAQVVQSGMGKNRPEVQALADEAKAALGGYYREYLLARATPNGWSDCGHNTYRPGTVLDPFSGSGTTGLAATRHGRRYVGIDLSAEYLDLSLRTRLAQGALIPDGEVMS